MSKLTGEQRYVLNKEDKGARIEEQRERLRTILSDILRYVNTHIDVNSQSMDIIPSFIADSASSQSVSELRSYLERVLETGGYAIPALRSHVPEYQTIECTVRGVSTADELFEISANMFRLIHKHGVRLADATEQLSQFLGSIDSNWEQRLRKII